MEIDGRFTRAKTRLVQNEQAISKERALIKRLGKQLPDETIKIPKIGEWSLAAGQPLRSVKPDQTNHSYNKRIQPFPRDIALSTVQRARLAKTRDNQKYSLPDIKPNRPKKTSFGVAPFIVRPPPLQEIDPLQNEANVSFPPGTSTTNLDDILKSRYRVTQNPLRILDTIQDDAKSVNVFPIQAEVKDPLLPKANKNNIDISDAVSVGVPSKPFHDVSSEKKTKQNKKIAESISTLTEDSYLAVNTQDPQYMPLELFDDDSFIEYPLEELMKDPRAYSKYTDIDNETYWAPCTVLNYNENTRLFLIEWRDTGRRKKVSRFNLRFRKEDPKKYHNRVEAAKQASIRFESIVRFESRVEQMPTENLPELSPQNLKDIYDQVKVAVEPKYQKLVQNLQADIERLFLLNNNRLEFEYNILVNPLIPNHDEFIQLIPKQKPVADLYLIETFDRSRFQEMLTIIQNKHLFATPSILRAISDIWFIFQNSVELSLLKNGYPEIIQLDDFVKRQLNYLNETSKNFKKRIITTLEGVTQFDISEHYTDQERARYRSMFILTTYMLHTVLLSIVNQSLNDYTGIFTKYILHPSKLGNIKRKQILNQDTQNDDNLNNQEGSTDQTNDSNNKTQDENDNNTDKNNLNNDTDKNTVENEELNNQNDNDENNNESNEDTAKSSKSTPNSNNDDQVNNGEEEELEEEQDIEEEEEQAEDDTNLLLTFKIEPQFTVELVFDKEKGINFLPEIETFEEKIIYLLDELDGIVHELPNLGTATFEDLQSISFSDCTDIIKKQKGDFNPIFLSIFKHQRRFLQDHLFLNDFLKLDSTEYVNEFDPTGATSLTDYRSQLLQFSNVLNDIQNNLKLVYRFKIIEVHCESFKKKAIEHLQKLNFSFLSQIKRFALQDITDLKNEFDQISVELKKTPNTPEELAKMKRYWEQVYESVRSRNQKMSSANARFSFLEEFQFEVSNDDIQFYYKTLQMPQTIAGLLDEAERTLSVERIRMIRELRSNQSRLETDTQGLVDALTQFSEKYTDPELTIEACDQINEIATKLRKLEALENTYNNHERLFEFEQVRSKNLQKLVEDFTPLHTLWNLFNEWVNVYALWRDTPFPQIKAETISSFIQQSTKKITKLKRDLSQQQELVHKVLNPLSEQIETFKQRVPLITKLRNPGIKTKHWEDISSVVGFSIQPSMELTLQNFLDLNLEQWNDQIMEIASVAANEYQIEITLDSMEAELQSKIFETVEFRNSGQYILHQVEDNMSIIDDQLITTQTLLTSPFIGPSKKRANDRLAFLRLCQQTLESWLQCQRSWLYLQPIFTGTSIQQKLQKEAAEWKTVETLWNATMKMTRDHPEFNTVMAWDSLLPHLKQCNELLENITHGLNQYLETKRLGFPRFFFLSNDELISILSHTKDFGKIQESMQKLFEYVNAITVTDDLEITEMIDSTGEVVKLSNSVDGDTSEIEDWLNAFEEEMKNTLREYISDSIEAHSTKKVTTWIKEFPAQVILIANQIMWTQQVTKAFHSKKRTGGLKTLLMKYIDQLDQLTSLVRQPISKLLRQLVSAMLINEVHNRDIISSLFSINCRNEDSFDWQKQLRYYWEEDTVIVRSINNAFEFNYEYAGNSARLVITPLTDRCYQTLLSAFKQYLSGAPSGPAGTGKTETVRDCAKALGRPCVVYNCSEEVTPEQMSQFFAGLSSSGSWSCFDEFNRINIEVLSVIAQQVRTIQNAIATGMQTFILDQRTLKLNPNAAICITMNPGYAGRTELPDNLKALFRPCAMMVPDFVFISEIMLFSGGFTTASTLSVKLVALFDLCRKQLSNAHHYDWGLRAMKAILSTAGKAKRNNLKEKEDLLLVQTIRECTSPRLVSADSLLFEGIIHDVFPNVISTKSSNILLMKHLKESFSNQNSIPMPVYLNKCMELYETAIVRHGIMLIGGAMGGKSNSWKALANAMTSLANSPEKVEENKPVHVESLNPKAISISELYGAFNPVTSEWADGVLSQCIRNASFSEQNELKWIIVDGPVDSLWIESMNSLLDDNKVLCLPNNERIQLGPHVKMIFEVDNLDEASPATVSRCGMVYFDPSILTPVALLQSWLNTHLHSKPQKTETEVDEPQQINNSPSNLNPQNVQNSNKSSLKGSKKLKNTIEKTEPNQDYEFENELVEFIRTFIGKILAPLCQFVQFDGKTALPINPNFCVRSMFALIDSYWPILRKLEKKAVDIDEFKSIDPLDSSPYFSQFAAGFDEKVPIFCDNIERSKGIFERIIIFTAIWSFGGVLSEESRQMFDAFFKELLTKIDSKCQFPMNTNIFSVFPDLMKDQWISFVDGQTNTTFTQDLSIEDQMIPVNECVAPMFITRLLSTPNKNNPNSYNVLLMGPETSKSLIAKTLFGKVFNSSFECHSLTLANCSIPNDISSYMQLFMHKKMGTFGPLPNHHLIFLLDNLGRPKPEIYGAQPPLELLRQFFDYGGWYQTSTVEFQKIIGTSIIATMGVPGGGLYGLPHRLLRHFFFLHIPSYQNETLNTILYSLMKQNYTFSSINDILPALVEGMLALFTNCKSHLLPIPSKLHYVFGIRSLVRVIRGINLLQPQEVSKEEDFVRIWYHEMMREFYDRLNTHEDRKWFKQQIQYVCSEKLKHTYLSIVNPTTKRIMYSEFADSTNKYKEIKIENEKLLRTCNQTLEEMNRDAEKPVDIVLFDELLTHLSSLSRIFALTGGHALLIGVKSSGRKSLARLAFHMGAIDPFEIQITRTYGFTEWREDIKNLVRQCGLKDITTGFIISDVQIIMQKQLEDLANLLTTCRIPQLYERDEFEAIKAELSNSGDDFSIPVSFNTGDDQKIDYEKIFYDRVRKNLHIVLVFSPYGSQFRDSMLSYPALRTETTMDWYMPWSQGALESVARAVVTKIGEPTIVEPVVNVCVKIHKSAATFSANFKKETKRFTAITPSRYFELLDTFTSKLKAQEEESAVQIKNYAGGVEKIIATRQQIEEMSKQLDRDIPVLENTRHDVEKLIEELKVKQGEVEETKKEVQAKQEAAANEAAKAEETNRIAQEQLEAAEPLLKEAQDAVLKLDKDSLVNIKKLHNPSAGMKETFEAVCIMFGKSPRKVQGLKPGVKEDDYWPEAVSLLNDIMFIKNIQNFKIESIPRETIQKLKKYVPHDTKARKEKAAAATASFAAVGALYDWVCASYDYWHTYQEILPKKMAAEEAQKQLEESQKVLAEAEEHLNAVQRKLQELQDNVTKQKDKEKELNDNVSKTQARLFRAQKIMSGLSGETSRWQETADKLKQSAGFILGDTLLIAGVLTYLGAFSPSFRLLIIQEWKKFLDDQKILYSSHFNIADSLGNEGVIRDWVVKGLPNDSHSVENALIITQNEQSFPLLIDPQLSGTKWLKNVVEKLTILRFDQPNFLQILKGCVTFGIPVLIENVGLKLDPLIDPILNREIAIVENQKRITLGGEAIAYSDNFRLFICTKYPNPIYSPEICSQVSLINFTTTQDGLTDLLLNNMIEVEREDLDRKRVSIMEENAENMKKLKVIEAEILQIVSNAGSDILDDDAAIDTLTRAQKTSALISQQMAASEITQKQINEFKTTFAPVAQRAALLYFCVSDFSVIDPMYQFSLKWFVSLFRSAITKTQHSQDSEQLIIAFNQSIASTFYKSVSFSLFSRHKLLFSTLMLIRIQTSEKLISPNELAFLLSPTTGSNPNPTDYLPDNIWGIIDALSSSIPAFADFPKSLVRYADLWQQYMDSESPHTELIPPLFLSSYIPPKKSTTSPNVQIDDPNIQPEENNNNDDSSDDNEKEYNNNENNNNENNNNENNNNENNNNENNNDNDSSDDDSSDNIENSDENDEKYKKYQEMLKAKRVRELEDANSQLTAFQRLLVLRIFHLEKMREGLHKYISENLGEEFVTPPTLNLLNVFKESDPLSPLIFIIMPGIDPQDEIIGVAQTLDTDKYLKSYSLGRGRGQGAEELIEEASEKGNWVLLQNCHLSLSWMPKLENIVNNLDQSKTHPRFRLCLVTMSSSDFPIGILYQGTKLVYEIPKGMRENVMRIYSQISSEEYDNSEVMTQIEKRLTFNLAFFHAIVLERLQFGSIGWNIPYEFNPSDFAISRKHLRTFLLEYNEENPNPDQTIIPFEALSYVIGELNYGGRVTDRWDRRLLISLLRKFFSRNSTFNQIPSEMIAPIPIQNANINKSSTNLNPNLISAAASNLNPNLISNAPSNLNQNIISNAPSNFNPNLISNTQSNLNTIISSSNSNQGMISASNSNLNQNHSQSYINPSTSALNQAFINGSNSMIQQNQIAASNSNLNQNFNQAFINGSNSNVNQAFINGSNSMMQQNIISGANSTANVTFDGRISEAPTNSLLNNKLNVSESNLLFNVQPNNDEDDMMGFEEDNSVLNDYILPDWESPLEQLIETVNKWPVVTSSLSVGLSQNASTITARKEAMSIFSSLIDIQPSLVAVTDAESEEAYGINLVESLQMQLPKEFNIHLFEKKLNSEDTMNTVLHHELLLYNDLLKVIRESLEQMEKGLKGLILIDEKLEMMSKRLFSNKVPEQWLEKSFPSILSLHHYMIDLNQRVKFIDEWARMGTPCIFKLGAFFHPEEFLTAALQVYARKHVVPFDSLTWLTTPLPTQNPKDIRIEPEEGIYIEGLPLEGAKWSLDQQCLIECGQKDLQNQLPIFHLRPTQEKCPYDMKVTYECPVYRTQNRGTGALDLPNYIVSLYLPAGEFFPDHWVQRSVAAFITTE